jgi:type VII secretion-associated serine protease mycosin
MAGKPTWLRLVAAVVSGAAMALLPAPLVALPSGPASLAPAVRAAAAGSCGSEAAQPGSLIVPVPWQQRWLDPERVWPFATGAGQVVAVIDTGVDGTHQQLSGHVRPGFDELRGAPDGNLDCVSHGTAVASLVVAQKVDAVGFHGVAPGAEILPVRVSNVDPATDPNDPKQASPGAVAQAISWAAGHGATVIEVSPSFTADTPVLRAAVRAALNHGIPVVAAAGDRHVPDAVTDPPTYPAAYSGVIGVGAVDATFGRWGRSNMGRYVAVTAPGDGVVAATRIAGQQAWSGTSIAAGVVAGAVALLRQVAPQLTPVQVAARIAATADPVPGGQLGTAYGAGLVDPYRAVTERASGGWPRLVPGVPPPSLDPAAIARERAWRRTGSAALLIVAVSGGLLVLIVTAAFVMPRGHRRGWRPTRAAPPPAAGPEPEVDDDHLFAVPKRPG